MAEDGVIKKIIRLVLDRNSADKVEGDAKKAIGGVDDSLEKLKGVAMKVGAALAAAFAVQKIMDFGRRAVDTAMESEQVWSSLASTIDAAGGSFAAMEADINAAAVAFQHATKYGDEDYAATLDRLVVLTGDVSASTQNMGLVADVAARFFGGELGPATELVSKAMNGNVTMLQKMGISAGSAQEALDILAQRSMGAAEAQANTMAGRVESLNQSWGDFYEAIGFAIIGTDGAGDSVGGLTDLVRRMTDWVSENSDTIKAWVSGGWNVLIHALDGTYRLIKAVSNFTAGVFVGVIGAAAKGVALWANAALSAVEIGSKFARFLGAEGVADSLDGFTERMRGVTASIDEFAETARDAGRGLWEDALSNITTSSVGGGGTRRPGLQVNAPAVGKNAVAGKAKEAKEVKDPIADALKAYEDAGQRITTMQNALGDSFDWVSEEIKRTTDLMVALVQNGVDPSSEQMQALHRQLKLLTAEGDEVNEIIAEMGEKLGQDLAAGTALGVSSLSLMQSEAQTLQATIRQLIAEGLDPADERLMNLAARYRDVTDAIRGQTEMMEWQTAAAGTLAGALGAAIGGSLGPFAMGKAKTNALEALELGARAFTSLLNPFTAPLAGGYAAGAAKHLAIAAGWRALASTFGSGGSGTAAVAASTASRPASGPSVGSARSMNSSTASRAAAPTPQIAVHFVGPGFDAVNPQVQRVVAGATQQAVERYGKNVRIVRSGGTR